LEREPPAVGRPDRVAVDPAVREPAHGSVRLEEVEVGEDVRRRSACEHDQLRIGAPLASAAREQRRGDCRERERPPRQRVPPERSAQSASSVAWRKVIVESRKSSLSNPCAMRIVEWKSRSFRTEDGMLQTRVVRRVAVGLAIAALAFAIAIPALAVTNPGS